MPARPRRPPAAGVSDIADPGHKSRADWYPSKNQLERSPLGGTTSDAGPSFADIEHSPAVCLVDRASGPSPICPPCPEWGRLSADVATFWTASPWHWSCQRRARTHSLPISSQAVEAMCVGDSVAAGDVLPALLRLIPKSLIVTAAIPDSRAPWAFRRWCAIHVRETARTRQ